MQTLTKIQRLTLIVVAIVAALTLTAAIVIQARQEQVAGQKFRRVIAGQKFRRVVVA